MQYRRARLSCLAVCLDRRVRPGWRDFSGKKNATVPSSLCHNFTPNLAWWATKFAIYRRHIHVVRAGLQVTRYRWRNDVNSPSTGRSVDEEAILIYAVHFLLQVSDDALQRWLSLSLPEGLVQNFTVTEADFRRQLSNCCKDRPKALKGTFKYLDSVGA